MRRLVGPLLVGLLVALAGWLAQTSRWPQGALLDAQSRDGFFWLRSAVLLNPPVDHRIHLIGFDPDCDRLLRKPTLLWCSEYARVIARLTEAGARVVALDLVISPELDGLDENDPFRRRLEDVERELALATLGSKGSVLLGGYLRGQVWEARPGDVLYGAAEADGNLVALNVATDPDGTVRRLAFLWDDSGRPRALFARAAELAEARELRWQKNLSWGGRALPGPTLVINYPGRPGTLEADGRYLAGQFPYTPFSTLLKRLSSGVGFEDFRGDICLLGPEAGVWQDLAATPYSRWSQRDTIGLEVHAAGLNSLLTGRWLKPLSPGATAAVILALALATGGLALTMRPGWSLLAAALLVLFYLLGSFALFCADICMPLLFPVIGAVLAYAGGYMERYVLTERERRRIRQIFGNMVSPQVMETVLAHPEALPLGGARRSVTVLFTDINNFTPQCERSTPEEIIVRLNAYFDEMVSLVFFHGGDLKQFVGDEIMAIFGATQNQPDHAARAVRCGLDMLARLRELAAQDPEGRHTFHDVKMGINTGDAVVGLVGSANRYEYAAVGDNVNLGARIMGLTKSLGADLLVSAATMRQARPLLPGLVWTSRGTHGFKGKSEQMELFEVCEKVWSEALPAPDDVGDPAGCVERLVVVQPGVGVKVQALAHHRAVDLDP